MEIRENVSDMSLDVLMTKKEVEDGILLSIMRNSDHTFLPYDVDFTSMPIPEEVKVRLVYHPRGSRR